MGLGLMGGSLGLALKARGFGGTISGYARRAETRNEALRMGVVDQAYDAPEKAVVGANMVILCVPILAMPDLVMSCRRSLHHRCIVTDVGSTHVCSVDGNQEGNTIKEYRNWKRDIASIVCYYTISD